MVKKYLIKRSQVVAILIFLVEIIGSFALVQIDASENILGKIGYVAIIYGVLSTIALYQVKKEWDVFLIFMIMCYLFSFGQCILTAFGYKLGVFAFSMDRGFFSNQEILNASVFCFIAIALTGIGFCFHRSSIKYEKLSNKPVLTDNVLCRVAWGLLLISVVPTFYELYKDVTTVFFNGYALCPKKVDYRYGMSFVRSIYSVLPNFLNLEYISIDEVFSPYYTVTNVILLEEGNESGQIDVMYHCPPAKAIGAIGMREDTMPDIVILVEDDMAKALFMELKRKYFSYYPEQAYLDIRVLEIGGYKNVINFYVEANNYVFYDNVFVTAFMDKDVETDVIPYPQYGNQEDIQRYHDHSRFLKFLPYTPEVLLVKTYIERKQQFLQSLRAEYSNQQVDYSIAEQLDFTAYEAALPNFSNQTQYNSKIEERGSFRKKCKQVAEKIALELSQQLNITVKEVYRYSYKFAVENIPENELNVRALLAQTMKRVR